VYKIEGVPLQCSCGRPSGLLLAMPRQCQFICLGAPSSLVCFFWPETGEPCAWIQCRTHPAELTYSHLRAQGTAWVPQAGTGSHLQIPVLPGQELYRVHNSRGGRGVYIDSSKYALGFSWRLQGMYSSVYSLRSLSPCTCIPALVALLTIYLLTGPGSPDTPRRPRHPWRPWQPWRS